MKKEWRPEGWWNPFDYMDIKGAGIGIDVFIDPETGEKMPDALRQRCKGIIEFGADMMLEAIREKLGKMVFLLED